VTNILSLKVIATYLLTILSNILLIMYCYIYSTCYDWHVITTKEKQMTYLEVKEYYKTDERIAVELGISHASVRKWKANGIGHVYQLAIQTLTKGKLKAENNV